MTIATSATTSNHSKRKGRSSKMIAMPYPICLIKTSISSKLWKGLLATANPIMLDSTKLFFKLRTTTPNLSPNLSRNKMKPGGPKPSSKT